MIWASNDWSVMVKVKIKIGRPFNPERYGMIYCPVCNGIGKLFNETWEGSVCEMCGGFGLVKKQEEIKQFQLMRIYEKRKEKNK